MHYVVYVMICIGLLYVPVDAQTTTQNFHPLNSSAEFAGPHGKITLEVRSEVSFADHLISDSLYSQMSNEEKEAGQASVYYYQYIFTNTGSVKLRFTIANYNVLRSPLFQFSQDFSIILEPGQTKTIKFAANTTPNVSDAPCLIMGWSTERNRWWLMGGWAFALYIPHRSAIAEEMP